MGWVPYLNILMISPILQAPWGWGFTKPFFQSQWSLCEYCQGFWDACYGVWQWWPKSSLYSVQVRWVCPWQGWCRAEYYQLSDSTQQGVEEGDQGQVREEHAHHVHDTLIHLQISWCQYWQACKTSNVRRSCWNFLDCQIWVIICVIGLKISNANHDRLKGAVKTILKANITIYENDTITVSDTGYWLWILDNFKVEEGNFMSSQQE